MRKCSLAVLVIILMIPFIMVINSYPIAVVWFGIYVTAITLIIKKKSSSLLEKGIFIIYIGTVIAVFGQKYIPVDSNSPFEIKETFYQIMIIVSSALGGGFLSHTLIEKVRLFVHQSE